jgi:hypothetical protein
MPLPITVRLNLGNNEWIVGLKDQQYMKMVVIKVTGKDQYTWLGTRHVDSANCSNPSTFTIDCWSSSHAVDLGTNMYPVELTTEVGIVHGVRVKREEDGLFYEAAMEAERFVEFGGRSSLVKRWPLVGPAKKVPHEATYGVRFSVPAEGNAALPSGTYASVAPVVVHAAPMDPANTGAHWSADVRLRFEVLQANSHASFMAGSLQQYESRPFEYPNSGLYFVAADARVGPTAGVWWGQSSSVLTVHLRRARCGGAAVPWQQIPGMGVALALTAQQRSCNMGWGTDWQMNAGRIRTDCEHRLILALADQTHVIADTAARERYAGCELATNQLEPVEILPQAWHYSGTPPDIGRLLIGVSVIV